MKKLLKLILILITGTLPFFGQQLILVQESKSDYSIIVSKNAGKYELTAASILQDYIEKITDCKLPVLKDSEKKTKHEIVIGYTNRNKKKKKELYDLRKDGYWIKTNGSKLIITGGSEKGVIYGVTGFLEDHLKVKKFTPQAEYIPKSNTILLQSTDDVQIPPADMRIVHCEFTNDSLYSYFRKITSIEDHWKDGDYNGYYVHTFLRSIPPEKYFDTHPEYFALINSKRVPYGQLCLSNPEVLRIVKEDIQEQISKHPKLHYWSVSQNDNYYHCECDKCNAINDIEGSPSGLILRFVNEIAKDFPDKTITTLAYQYTRKPPLKTKPLKNVLITLCTIELNRSKPIESDPTSADFVKEIQDWAKISDNIKIWDYETQFTNSFGPFPLYNTLKSNIQFFTKNNAKAHFQQCNGKHSENLSELKCYLLSKLLWNPNANDNDIINEFLFGFYGDAAPYIRMYFDRLHKETRNAEVRLDIYGTPVWLAENILSVKNMKAYNGYFDKAEKAVRDEKVLFNRVRAARLPLMFSAIEIAKTDLFGPRGWYDEKDGKFIKKPEMNKILDDFYSICKHDSITSLNEKGLTPDFFYHNTLRNIDVQTEGNIAFRKKISCDPHSDPRYTGIGNQLLTNGVKGTEDYKINWLGWEGMDTEINIDLDSVQNINKIEISTLHMPDVWILHPASVTALVSTDGKEFYEIGKEHSDPGLKYKSDIKSFSFSKAGLKTRHIKFLIKSTIQLPEWHAYRGNKSWVFVDEIIIK